MLILQFFVPVKVGSDWRDIALTLHDKVLEENEEHLIDIHDAQVKRSAICLAEIAEKCSNPFCVSVIYLAQLCPPLVLIPVHMQGILQCPKYYLPVNILKSRGRPTGKMLM